MTRVSSKTAAFTLLEMVAVTLLVGLVFSVVVNLTIDVRRSSEAAIAKVETPRRALAIIDRIARDLENAVLVETPPGRDPLAHPWLFVAIDDDTRAGAEALKFVSRGRRPRAERHAESDLEIVSWWIASDGASDVLHRSASAGLPPSLDRELPNAEPATTVAADIAEFSLRFRASDGTWVDEWDSTTVAHANDLPIAAEISLSLYEAEPSEKIRGPYRRQLMLPLTPLDLDGSLEDGGATGDTASDDEDQEENEGSDGEGGGGMSVSQCLALHPELVGGDQGTSDALGSLSGSVSDNRQLFESLLGPVPADCL